MRRTIALLCLALVIAVVWIAVWQPSRSPAQQQPAPAAAGRAAKALGNQLPISQVILFSSGVGFFQREGEVDGNARIDFSFPVTDINDLLKSMVLQDLNGGRISTVSYDSHDPIEKTLRSFALDLTYNPTFAQLLNQARGEKVEVVMQTSTTQPGTMTGTIVGMEAKAQPAGKDGMVEIEMLNLLCADGVRSVKLSEVQRVRFLNPALDSELKRALDVLSMSHDSQKKTVSISFNGDGKRTVRVGYVVENPIWKTSYRLVLPASGGRQPAGGQPAEGKTGKPFLQGWAVVENITDDDWSNVRMSLVSGRPISFQMDLYQPLYIPRPTEEPELFASLRPPTYSGSMTDNQAAQARGAMGIQPGTGYPGAPGNFAGGGVVFGGQPGFAYRNWPGQGGRMPPGGGQAPGDAPQPVAEEQLALQAGQAGRLGYTEYFARQQQAKQAAKMDAAKFAERLGDSVKSAASASEIGDFFQYIIDHPVSLPRQKSAMLPVVNQNVEGTKVSIYNERVHAKFPLHGLKFKNTSGLHLMQGPITVFEGNSYAGDARILDLQPNEERLLSYAIDLGVEVEPLVEHAPIKLTSVKLVKGIMHVKSRLRETKKYNVKNRSEHDRVVLLEHPFRADYKLVTPEKASERSREVYRFELKVPTGKSASQEIIEEKEQTNQMVLTNLDDQAVRYYINSDVSSPQVKLALEKALKLKTELSTTQREIADLDQQLKEIREDQTRLRANLKEMPATANAYKRYLEKFDKQETEIEKLQDQTKKLRQTETEQRKGYEAYLMSLKIE